MSKIVYLNSKVELICGSCFTYLKKIKPKTVSFIFADPPYFLSGDGITCSGGKMVGVKKADWDEVKQVNEKLTFSKKWLKECMRILKDDGTIMISGTYHIIHIIGTALEQTGFKIINNITWEKKNPPPNLACKCFTHSSETILWAKKHDSRKYFFNYQLMKEINNGKQMKDVWIFGRPKRNEFKFGKHPTQKPVDLLERIILATTKENDVVLDPFMGSGTTGVASVKLKRKFIGIEKEKEYIEIAKKRIIEEEVNNYD